VEKISTMMKRAETRSTKRTSPTSIEWKALQWQSDNQLVLAVARRRTTTGAVAGVAVDAAQVVEAIRLRPL
jgi:hypothetical protein